MFTIFIYSLQYIFTNKESSPTCLSFNAFKKPLLFEKAHFLHFLWNQNKTIFSFSFRSGRQAHSWFVNDYVLFTQVRNTEKNRNCWRRNQVSVRRMWFLKLEGPERPPGNNQERRKHRLCDTSETLPAKWAHFSTMFRKFCFQLFIGSIKQLSWFADSIFILIYFAKFLL